MNRDRTVTWIGLVAVAIAFIVVRGATGGARPFLDGYTPPTAYRWVSPPPNLASTNQVPTGGDTTIQMSDGASVAAGAFTDDGQVTISFNPGTFADAPGQTAVRVRITPMNPQPPSPAGTVTDGNVYLMEASFIPSGKPAVPLRAPVLLDMRYPGHKPDAIYRIDGKTWTPLESTVQELLLTVDARATQLGTFAAAHQEAGSAPKSGSQNPLILLAVGVATIVGVALLAGVRIRRRR
ncbi:MAG: hypothetical protein PVSMB9_08150 [Candidatus Dormibacteria bacterium]